MYNASDIQTVLKECANECVLPYFQNLEKEDIATKSHAEDFVTIADKKSEEYLERRLTHIVPGSIVLGEESFFVRGFNPEGVATKDVWIVDPIDGTRNFKDGKDNFCILLAHAHEGRLMGAWIYAPRLGKMVSWKQGEAVTLNNQPISLDTDRKSLGQMIVGDHVFKAYPDYKEELKQNRKFFGPEHVHLGSFGIETLWMVENKIDALSFGKCNPWDIAPCAALIEAMGGKAMKM